MTNEEAKELLDNLIGMVIDNQDSDYDMALKIGIKALEQEEKTDTWSIKDIADTLAKHGLIAEQEPCEDAISRQAVIDTIYHECSGENLDIDFAKVLLLQRKIKALPSVNPQKTGHWIIEKWNNKEHYSCSSCQHVVDYEPCYHYCPYCGAKMVEPQESEVKE